MTPKQARFVAEYGSMIDAKITDGTVTALEPWRPGRLMCAIGHSYGGRVRVVKQQRAGMDGDPVWTGPITEFQPKRCVVCGLVTWKEIGGGE